VQARRAYPPGVYRERFGTDTFDPDFIVGDIA
jgi:hypothetical protein